MYGPSNSRIPFPYGTLILLSISKDFCLNDFSHYISVTSMLSTLNLPSLQKEISQTYKIINGDLHIPSNSLIPNPHDSKKNISPDYNPEQTHINFPFFPLPSSYGTLSPL